MKEKQIFQVQKWVDIFGSFIDKTKNMWISLGNFESKVLKEDIDKIKITQPIYVSGLARSGTTILLEILSHHQGLVSQQYKDFPPVYTPFWWNWLLNRMLVKKVAPVERAHRDGILVTPDSPEAVEEILWMHFFPEVHNPSVNNILDQNTNNPDFETFYGNHIRKLLLTKKGNRYLAKGNYNITRLEYILKIFPNAKFIIPIRHPINHLASLLKQHKLFCQGGRENPKALKHLQRIGHFEFGLDIRPINVDGQEITTLAERDIKAWASYWSKIYGYIKDKLESNPKLQTAVMIVKFEDLCDDPETMLQNLMKHCNLTEGQAIVEKYVEKIKPPSYYKPDFTNEELTIIDQETQQVAEKFGY